MESARCRKWRRPPMDRHRHRLFPPQPSQDGRIAGAGRGRPPRRIGSVRRGGHLQIVSFAEFAVHDGSLLFCRRHRHRDAGNGRSSFVDSSGREGVVTVRLRRCLRLTAPRPHRRKFLPSCRHHPDGSCFAASDHASSSPPASYWQGRASVWLVCVSPSRCGHEPRTAPQPSRIHLRPPSPTPRSTAANAESVPALAVAGTS